MKIEIELNDDEKKQAFIDYCWKTYGLDGDKVDVYAALGQLVFYVFPEKEGKNTPEEYRKAKEGE